MYHNFLDVAVFVIGGWYNIFPLSLRVNCSGGPKGFNCSESVFQNANHLLTVLYFSDFGQGFLKGISNWI